MKNTFNQIFSFLSLRMNLAFVPPCVFFLPKCMVILLEHFRYYSASIIAMAGISDDQTAIWLSAVTAFFNFVFTFVGLWMVERLGRRPLVLGSLFGVAAALMSLGLSFNLTYLKSPTVSNSTRDSICSDYE